MGCNNPVHWYQHVVVQVHRHCIPKTNSKNTKSLIDKIFIDLVFVVYAWSKREEKQKEFFKNISLINGKIIFY